MAVALPLIAAGASIAGGFAQAAASRTEAKQLDRVRRDEAIRGKQISARHREETNEALATIDSLRAARGLDIDSPGGVNFSREQRQQARENENAEVLTSKNRQETLKTQAALKRRAAPFQILGGFGQAAGSLTQTFG